MYHAPKMPDLNLEGQEGTVKQVVKFFKDKELSANLPYKTEFIIPREGEKDLKLLVHLVRHWD